MTSNQQSIPPDVYDREYFISEICEGFDEAKQGEVSFNKAKQVRMLEPGPGVKILDAGCGRGETLLACARAGAEVAGIDYSEAAVELTREFARRLPGGRPPRRRASPTCRGTTTPSTGCSSPTSSSTSTPHRRSRP